MSQLEVRLDTEDVNVVQAVFAQYMNRTCRSKYNEHGKKVKARDVIYGISLSFGNQKVVKINTRIDQTCYELAFVAEQ